MISKSILAALAIAATVGIAAPASAEFVQTGTAARSGEGGLGAGGDAWPAPHGSQVLINHLRPRERSE